MRRWLGRLGILAVALLAVVAALFGVAWVASERALDRRFTVADAPLAFAGDAAEAGRGAHLFAVLGCADCHGEDGAGRTVFEAGPIGRMVGANITPAKVGDRYDRDAMAAAIRHGVRPDGRPLMFMPSGDFVNLSDADTAAIVRHVQSLPPRDDDPGASVVGPLGRVLALFGKLHLTPAADLDHSPRVRTAPPQSASAGYGAYLAQVCTGCHGADLAGQRVPGTPASLPAAANLTPHADGLQGWSEADFFRAIREGRRPDGRALDPFMPWRTYASMTDVELRAIWLHLSALPPRPDTAP